MLHALIQFDYHITYFINSLLPRNDLFAWFFRFFSVNGASLLVWILVILLVLIIEERQNPGIQKRDIQFIVIFTVSFLITTLIANYLLKFLIFRPRPFTFININNVICPRDSSFPSNHAATAFASALILTSFDKKRKWFYYTVAVIISLSRIYFYCHYFFDVVGGAIIGMTISLLISQSLNFKKTKSH